MNIHKLRAYTLFYFALAQQGQQRRLSWAKLEELLQWEGVSSDNVGDALSFLPDTIDFDWDDDGLIISYTHDEVEETRQYVKLPSAERSAMVKRIFEHWRVTTKRTRRVVFSRDRRAKIELRLKEGFTEQELKDAIEGIMLSSFHCGENDTGAVYNDITHVFKSASNVERFVTLKHGQGSGGSGSVNKRLDEIRKTNVRRRGRRRRTGEE